MGEIIDNYIRSWSRAFDISGRARRSEFWYFGILNVIVYIIVSLVSHIILGNTTADFISTIMSVVIFVGSIAILVRRLHDIGKPGWWWFVGLVPILGAIILLFFCVMDSQYGDNQYGVNPKY